MFGHVPLDILLKVSCEHELDQGVRLVAPKRIILVLSDFAN